MPELSIVIVNYNTREKLKDCLTSIAKERHDLELEIIVVDNASQDDSPNMIRQIAPEAIVLEQRHNTWYSGGNNLGIQAASGDYVFILNPDTIILPNTLQQMLAYLKNNADVGAATCRQQHPDGEWLPTCSRLPHYIDLLLDYTLLGKLFPQWRNKRREIMWYQDWQRDTDKAIEVAPGSCIMAKRELLLRFAGFDKKLKLYFTDDDLCASILKEGYTIHFLAEPVLLHHEKSSIKRMQGQMLQIYFEDLLVFCRKNYGILPTLLLNLLLVPTQISMNLIHLLQRKTELS
jgi:N-acetylglucosaminyl-diphospho-decaprenol L-rhamnosyltransferase